MRISEQGRQNVPPRDFWLAVGVATLLLGAIGVSFMQTGQVSRFPSWVWAGLLLFVWGSALLDLLRYGPKIFSHGRWALLLGGTLFAGSHCVPYLGRAASWI